MVNVVFLTTFEVVRTKVYNTLRFLSAPSHALYKGKLNTILIINVDIIPLTTCFRYDKQAIDVELQMIEALICLPNTIISEH